MYVLKTAQEAVRETNLSISERSIMYTTIHLLLIYIKVHFKKVGGGGHFILTGKRGGPGRGGGAWPPGPTFLRLCYYR